MSSQAVPWRRVVVALVAVAVALGGTFVAVRSDGFSAIDATVPRATRWFVHQQTGQVVLADGFSGRALARLDAITGIGDTEVTQGAAGAAVIDRNEATARTVDPVALRLGSPQPVSVINQADAVIGVGQPGLVAVHAEQGEAVLLPIGGDPIPFPVPVASRTQTRIAPDGSVWMVTEGTLARVTTNDSPAVASVSQNSRLALVGNSPLLFDPDANTVLFGAGTPVALPDGVAPSEVVLQADGPAASCGWLGADDQLWCVGSSGIDRTVTIDGLDIDGGDLLGIAGDAAALVRRGNFEIVRFDWRQSRLLDGSDDGVASVPPGAQLAVSAGADLIWVDETDGDTVWAINPWGIRAIQKDDDTVPLIDEDGTLLDDESAGAGGAGGGAAGGSGSFDAPELNDDGINDPPVANPDSVTARAGAQVPIDVTANDYDPDGNAIAVVAVEQARSGRVEISTASTITYRPDSGSQGLVDQFEYTITDGDGLTSTTTVTLELLDPDAPNREPVGTADTAETGAGAEVVVDVLLNDVDPERDALRIASFTQPDIGAVDEVTGQSGLAAIRYTPPDDASGTARFTYRPVDALGAIGETVSVEVTIAATTADNQPPIVRPDAALVRRGIEARILVLANDRDPDGDRLTIDLVRPIPDGLDARVDGNDIVVVARAGIAPLTPFGYVVDDGNGNQVIGEILIALLDENEPNRAPLATPDSVTVVAGTTQLLDVLANDSDPDGDPIRLVGVRRDTPGGSITVRGDRVAYVALDANAGEEQRLDQFEYTITDGQGERSVGEVTVRVLPEPLAEPPFAQDDVASTTTGTPVTIDVLRNDGDPSGEPPSLIGEPGCQSGGSAAVVGDRVVFTPPDGQTGQFTCSYEVTNSQGLRASATIVINVSEPEVSNQAPIAVEDDRSVSVGETVRIPVLANDSDPDGDAISLEGFTQPTQGTAAREGDVIVYTAGTTVDVVTFSYEISDAQGERTNGSIVITITAADPIAPTAFDDARTVDGPGGPTVFDVILNDDDEDGNNADLVVVAVEVDSGDGRADFGTQTVTLTPDEDFVGDLVAIYTIADPDGLTASARAILTVLEQPNRVPIAQDDSASVTGGETVIVSLGLNDSDPDGDPLTYRIVSPPDSSLGLASLDGSSLVFSASTGANGVASVVYEISDGEATAEATVRIQIVSCTEADPIALDAFFETGYQQPITIDLNDLAENGQITDVGAPLNEAVSTYTPPAGENGNIEVTFVVRNSCGAQAVGTVVIDVNQDPIGSAYETTIGRESVVQIPISVLASDDEPLTITDLIAAPSWVSIGGGGSSVQVDPTGQSGTAAFSAVITDPGGLSVTVPVSVVLLNQSPVATDDQVLSTGGAVTFSPLANDSDPDGDAISLAAVPGTFSFGNGATGTITRQPNDDLVLDPNGGSGQATFTYTIVDSQGFVSEPATVTMSVNGAPVAPARIDVSIGIGSTDRVNVNASDPDGDPLTLSLDVVSSPLVATVAGLAVDVTVPSGSLGGVYEIRFTVADTNGASTSGSIFVTVSPPSPTTTTTAAPTTTTTVP